MNADETRAFADEQSAAADADYAELRTMSTTARPLTRLIVMVGSAVRSTVLRVVWHMADIVERLDALRSESTARGVASGVQLASMQTQTNSRLDSIDDGVDVAASRIYVLHEAVVSTLETAQNANAMGLDAISRGQDGLSDTLSACLIDVESSVDTAVDRLRHLETQATAISTLRTMEHGEVDVRLFDMISAVRELHTAPVAPAATLARLDTLAAKLDTLHADMAALGAPSTPASSMAGTLALAVLLTPFAIAPAGRVERIALYNAGGAAVEFEVYAGLVRIDHVRLTPNARDSVGPFTTGSTIAVKVLSGSAANLILTQWSVVYR